MKKQIIRKSLIIIFALILIERLFAIDYLEFWNFKVIGSIVIPILMILAMILSIRHVNKKGEN